jgi:hypothetical protein
MTNVIALSFDSNAAKIIGAHKMFDKASSRLSDTVETELLHFIDSWSIANDRSEASCKALQKAIVDCDTVVNIVASGAMLHKTFTEYALGAARALYFSVPWTASLKNSPDHKLPWSKKGKSTNPGTAGGVTSTTRDDMDKTISKALAQARLLGLTEFAADVLDLCIERLDGFRETVLVK